MDFDILSTPEQYHSKGVSPISPLITDDIGFQKRRELFNKKLKDASNQISSATSQNDSLLNDKLETIGQ